MKKGHKAKPEEIITTLRKIEILSSQGKTLQQACRECSLTENTFYRWRKQFGGMDNSRLKEFKDLQQENTRLKKIVADLTLDKLILTETIKGKF